MKRVLLSALFFLVGAGALFAFDFGGAIVNTTSMDLPVGDNEFALSQGDKATLWVNLNFSPNVLLNASGHYKFSYTTPLDLITHTGDLDSLVLFLSLPNAFGPATRENLWVGRTTFRDMTGLVLNHKLDGFISELTSGNTIWRLGIGTSALLFKHSSGIIISTADGLDRLDDDVLLAPPRLVFQSDLVFPRLFLGQNLSIGILGQADLRQGLSADGDTVGGNDLGGPLHQLYTGLKIDGKIAGPLFWSMYGYFSTGYGLSSASDSYAGVLMLAGLGGMDLNLFFPTALNSSISLGFLIGTGDTDEGARNLAGNTADNYNGFHTISKRSAGMIFSPQTSNLMQGRLGFSFKPFSGTPNQVITDFQISNTNLIFLRPLTQSEFGELAIKANQTEMYIGFESDITINWRITQELGFSIAYGVFAPNTAALDRTLEMKAKAELSLSF